MFYLLTDDDGDDDNDDTQHSEDFSAADSAVVEVTDIPSGLDGDKLTMIFESRRFTGVNGAKVLNVEFNDDDPSVALITFSTIEGKRQRRSLLILC